ncbi:protein TRI1-like isoform X3 [Populus alba x Populus x berolinensis]|uniref:Protein TRI1-like isoform X3 n=1 Tax=Populus alba x Populus x berolinensis TaxID=444605 RepID=A0AAD6MH05_9ROSI|nr:protein TRI1-like isoform X3 [Populus alba x Populus x berolinensis]
MVSDSDLVARLREILRSSDLDTATAGSIRRQLEEDFGVDLSEKKKFIREQIDTFLETLNKGDGQSGNVTENEDNENDTVEDDENENDGIKEEEEEEEDSETKESKGSDKTEKVRKRGGFAKLSSLSPQLQAVVGVPELARTEVVKKLWAYIRENNLQDPKNRKEIKCDEALRAVFHVNSIDMFQMNKALSKHIWPLTGENESVKQKEKSKDINDSGSEGDNGGEQEDDEEEVKKQSNERSKKGRRSAKVDEDVKKRGGGFTKLCSLSPQLQELVGVPELARTGVVKKLWAYIREKNLQDPKNKRNIICDESLRSIFDVDSIDMFQMNKALTKHIWAVHEEDAPSNSSPKKKETKQGREKGPDEPKQKEKRQKKVPHEPKKKEKQQKKGFWLGDIHTSQACVEFELDPRLKFCACHVLSCLHVECIYNRVCKSSPDLVSTMIRKDQLIYELRNAPLQQSECR